MKTRKQQFIIDLLVTTIALALAVLSVSMIFKLTIDSSTEVFLPTDSEAIIINNEIEDEFGSLDALILSVVNTNNQILNPNSLVLIESLTNQIEEIKGVHSVMSITNLDHIEADDFGLNVVPLYNGTNSDDIESMKNKLDSWLEIYENSLISKDGMMASIIITMDSKLEYPEQKAIMDSIKDLTLTSKSEDTSFIFIGLPVVKQQINESLVNDMIKLAPIVLALIILVLSLTLKKFSGVLLPLITLFISASYVVGLMILFDITFTMATMLVPVLLLIVASAYSIHVISHFYDELLSTKGDVSFNEIALIISSVIKRNRRPIILAGITTAAGFLAQLTSPLSPFRVFGILSAFGVIISQFASLFILPSFLRLTYRKGIKKETIKSWKKKEDKGFKNTISIKISNLVIQHKTSFIVVSLLLVTITLVLIPNIKSGTNMINFFKKDSKIVQDSNIYNNKMGGSGIVNIMVYQKNGNRILNPSFLMALESYSNKVEKLPQVGKVQTVIPYIKRMNYLLNQNTVPYKKNNEEAVEFDFFSDSFSFEDNTTEESYDSKVKDTIIYDKETFKEIPTDPLKYGLESEKDLTNLISQYLVLYSGNLDFLINDNLEPTKVNITIMLKDTSVESISNLISFTNNYWDNLDNFEIAIGGGEAISLTLTKLVTKSQIYSLFSSLIIIFSILSILFKSIKIGFIGLIPVGFALMGIFLSMSLLSIPLDIVTSLLAALAIGIGVDYAIHYISAYKREANIDGDDAFFISIMNTTGRAIIINMFSITVGFLGLIFSQFIPVQQMGILFCISMFAAGISSITVLPIVLSLMDKKRGNINEKK